jgi:hypothetical protein
MRPPGDVCRKDTLGNRNERLMRLLQKRIPACSASITKAYNYAEWVSKIVQ